MRPTAGSLAVALALTMAVAACSEGGEPADAPKAAAPAAEPGRPAIYAAAAEGPEPFVRALYAVYEAGGPKGETPPPGQDPIYGRTLNAMIGADFRKAGPDQAPFLNFDPICDCQDQGTFTLDTVAITETGQNKADAAVTFTNDGERKSQTLKLEREGPMWRVADVVKPGEPPLSEQLLKVIG
jgi:hypothetical protein